MKQFFNQLLLFLTVNLAGGWFRYFFLIVNFLPLLLYFFFGFAVETLIMYFILEAIAYCFMNLIYIKLIDLPAALIKVLLVMFSLTLIVLSVYYIPMWNNEGPSGYRTAFWNQAALLFSFYTLNFFFVGDKFYDWKESVLKRNVIVKFGVLGFVAIAGTLLSKYMQNDLGYLLVMVVGKSVVDYLALHKPAGKII